MTRTALRSVVILLGALCSAPWLRADLSAALAERNLEKRSEKAMQNADKALDTARREYRSGQTAKMKQALEEIEESVALCLESLKESGKDPRRNPKYFKRAEIRSRKLIRKLEDFRLQLGYEERAPVNQLIQVVQKAQHQLLMGIMGGKGWNR